MDELMLMKDMTDSQRALFQSQMANLRKDRTIAFVLTLFLGGLGAHRFYLGQIGLGVLYLVFCWTFIPMFISFVELFLILRRVDAYNQRVALDTAVKVKALGSAAAT